ncbi:TnpV protein [Agathobaculum sp. TL06]
MEKLKKHIYDEHNGLYYTLVGDYYIPDLELPEETRPIGIWGRMQKDYLEQYYPTLYNDLILSGRLWTYLADLNEQAQNQLECIIGQLKEAEGITEELKTQDEMSWVSAMNSIRSRAEEIILRELIYEEDAV